MKARMVAGGNTQQDYLTKVDPSSPTASNEATYWKVIAALEVYDPLVSTDKKGMTVLLAECWNAIYGTMIAGLLYYRKFTESLTEQGLS